MKKKDRINWAEAIANVPVEDWLEGFELKDRSNLACVVESFTFHLEGKNYLAWEAVIRDEQGLPLSEAQESVLNELVSFEDDEEEDILYINEWARPTEPWYASLKRLAAELVMPTYDTTDEQSHSILDAWPQLVESVDIHAINLELPKGVTTPSGVVPPEIRHRLWIQSSLGRLGGLGKYFSASDENGQENIRNFVCDLRRRKDSVEYLDMTLDSLLTILKLPLAEQPLFIGSFQKEIGLSSTKERIAPKL